MKNIKAPRLVTIAILSLMTIVFWVGFEVFRTFTRTPDLSIPKEIIDPINPTLDQDALGRLQGRMYIDEGSIGQSVLTTPVPIQTPQPTVEPTPESTASASPTTEATASASPEGGTQ